MILSFSVLSSLMSLLKAYLSLLLYFVFLKLLLLIIFFTLLKLSICCIIFFTLSIGAFNTFVTILYLDNSNNCILFEFSSDDCLFSMPWIFICYYYWKLYMLYGILNTMRNIFIFGDDYTFLSTRYLVYRFFHLLGNFEVVMVTLVLQRTQIPLMNLLLT